MEALDRAVADLKAKDYGSAIRSLELITARDPANPRAHKYLFRAYYDTGDLEKASDCAQRYTALCPTDAGGHFSAGIVLGKLGRQDAARRALQAALAADPAHAKARRALHDLDQQPEPAPVAAPSAVGSPEKTPTPWVARIAAIVTVIASLAIIAALFMPGGPANPGKPEVAPEPKEHAVVTPPPIEQTAPQPMAQSTPQPMPQPQVQPDPEPQPPTPRPEPQPTAPHPRVTQPPAQPSPEQQRAIQQMQQQLQQLYAAYEMQQHDLQAANQRTQAAQQAANQAAGDAARARAQQAAQSQPAQQAPQIQQPQAGLQQPTPQTFPAPAQEIPRTQMPPLLTPDEARMIVDDMDAIDTRKTREAVWYSLDSLRAPYLQTVEVWAFVKDSLPMMLASSGTSLGTYEIVQIIQPSNTGAQAADILERYTYDLHSVLPEAVKIEIARTLVNSQTPLDAWHGVDQLLRRTGTSTSIDAAAHLERALVVAQQTQMQRYRQSR